MHKIFRQAAFAVMALAAATSCDTKEYETLESGVQYKYIEEGEGASPSHGKVVVMKFAYTADDGDEFFSSSEMPNGNTVMVYDSTMMGQKGSIEEIISMMQVGDSVEAKVGAETFFKKTFNMDQLPDTVKAEENITFNIRLVEVADQQEYAERMSREQTQKDETAIEEYIAENNMEGLEKTESGLRYVITEEGDGPEVEQGDSVKINYTGYLLDGTVFDSSIEETAREAGVFMEGRPYEPIGLQYGITRFIPGWNEGIGYLSEGDKATLIIPSALAYGNQRRSAQIGPNSILVFELSVTEVKKNTDTAN
ncbi:FKBP-type peptidyl-prolyl cis-trans isomerase [Roseivirga sp. BDSF3-8]|uniref:FKBP-type peptidyl-prolyl cis-trans isomerase n=1 Tax=Roseivirga sp. BDSF3-8 TaxID=3241598 RepID=UPI003531D379